MARAAGAAAGGGRRHSSLPGSDSLSYRWLGLAVLCAAFTLAYFTRYATAVQVADALGDPSLVFGYTDPVDGVMRDETGRAVALW